METVFSFQGKGDTEGQAELPVSCSPVIFKQLFLNSYTMEQALMLAAIKNI